MVSYFITKFTWHASCLLPGSTQSKASRVEGTFYSPHHSLNFTIRGGHGVDKQPNGGCIVWFRFNRKGRSRGLLKTVSRPHRSNNVLKKTKKLLRRTIFSHIVNIIWDFICSRKVRQLSQPIIRKTKPNRDLVSRVFPRLRQFTGFCFEFWLVPGNSLICSYLSLCLLI